MYSRAIAFASISALSLVGTVSGLAFSTTPASEASTGVGDPVIGAVGDMACDTSSRSFNGGAGTSSACAQRRTSDEMLSDTSLDAVLGLGDYQYDCGQATDYAVSYTPTYGRLNDLMEPVVGNHEYQTGKDSTGNPCPVDNSTAAGYFDYFGASSHPDTVGHFSFDIGSWHLVALNAECTKTRVGGCSATSAQTKWLKADLASNTKPCTLAYWHQPLWRGVGAGVQATYRAWWNVLYGAHADVVLNGHVHNYQRFAPLNPSGAKDPVNGITEYIVGTGGEGLKSMSAGAVPQPVVGKKTFGYLRFTLLAAGWKAEFIDANGSVLDTSTGTCHV
jgi:hypothetical protein